MSGVSSDQIQYARSVDLLTYLQANEPQELRRTGPDEYRTVSHGSLVISKGLWVWNRGQCGGRSALDYLIKVRGMGFVDAVETILGSRSPPVLPLQVKMSAPVPHKTLTLPPPERFPKLMPAYLQKRGISADVLRRCIETSILYESRYNGAPVCVFVGKDERGEARFACMRGIESDIKRDCKGSDKRFGFMYPTKSPASTSLAAFESPVDLLSHLCLFPGFEGTRLSLGGTADLALTAFLERMPQITDVSLCLDNDDAGQTAVNKIKERLRERFPDISVTIDPPIYGKDYNEQLIHAKAAEYARTHAGHHKDAGVLF